jgi:MFS family permease
MLAHRPFARYFYGRVFSEFSVLIGVVAVGWQIYALTNSVFLIGMAGLVQFVPSALLVFVAGHVADRYDRRRIAQACEALSGLTACGLAWGSFTGRLTVPEIFTAIVLFGVAGAFEAPAGSALLPAVAPDGMLQRATAFASGAWQFASVAGPAFGGFAYAFGPGYAYGAMALFWFVSAALIGAIRVDRPAASDEPANWKDLFAGVGFVRANPAILGTISLDVFAVLLGGATALLPVYARDILHTGPWGLGVLRGAPAAGALVMTVLLARHTLQSRVGLRMFQAVIVFGAATVLFALSRELWLSIGALLIMGAADTVSVVIRSSLVQLATPDAMRGRVGAVNFLFINASNQLGEFESGVTAALLGTVPAAVIGGLGTIAVALLWMKLFPALRAVQRLEPDAISASK